MWVQKIVQDKVWCFDRAGHHPPVTSKCPKKVIKRMARWPTVRTNTAARLKYRKKPVFTVAERQWSTVA